MLYPQFSAIRNFNGKAKASFDSLVSELKEFREQAVWEIEAIRREQHESPRHMQNMPDPNALDTTLGQLDIMFRDISSFRAQEKNKVTNLRRHAEGSELVDYTARCALGIISELYKKAGKNEQSLRDLCMTMTADIIGKPGMKIGLDPLEVLESDEPWCALFAESRIGASKKKLDGKAIEETLSGIIERARLAEPKMPADTMLKVPYKKVKERINDLARGKIFPSEPGYSPGFLLLGEGKRDALLRMSFAREHDLVKPLDSLFSKNDRLCMGATTDATMKRAMMIAFYMYHDLQDFYRKREVIQHISSGIIRKIHENDPTKSIEDGSGELRAMPEWPFENIFHEAKALHQQIQGKIFKDDSIQKSLNVKAFEGIIGDIAAAADTRPMKLQLSIEDMEQLYSLAYEHQNFPNTFIEVINKTGFIPALRDVFSLVSSDKGLEKMHLNLIAERFNAIAAKRPGLNSPLLHRVQSNDAVIQAMLQPPTTVKPLR